MGDQSPIVHRRPCSRCSRYVLVSVRWRQQQQEQQQQDETAEHDWTVGHLQRAAVSTATATGRDQASSGNPRPSRVPTNGHHRRGTGGGESEKSMVRK